MVKKNCLKPLVLNELAAKRKWFRKRVNLFFILKVNTILFTALELDSNNINSRRSNSNLIVLEPFDSSATYTDYKSHYFDVMKTSFSAQIGLRTEIPSLSIMKNQVSKSLV